MRTRAILLLIITILIGGCVRATPPGSKPPDRPFTVAAASDLQLAFTEIGQLFEAKTGQKVVFTFGASGNLAKQIEHGAPVDLYAAANVAFVDDLIQKGLLLADTRQVYARGGLVLASSKAAGAGAQELGALLDPKIKRVAIANPDHAPYGAAAKEALINAGLWEQLQPKLVIGENVRQALQFVQTGNAEVGFVARSMADVGEVTYVSVDAELYTPLNQALGIVQGSPYEQIAVKFAGFLVGPEGRAVMEKYGFRVPD